MFIPYRVIQIKQNRYPSHRYPSHRDKLGLNQFHFRNNKSSDRHQICNSKQPEINFKNNQSLQRYQKNSSHSHDKSFKKSEQKQKAQSNIYRSLDFSRGEDKKNKQSTNWKNRPASSIQPHRKLSKKYKSTSIQNQTTSPAIIKKDIILKPKRKNTNKTFESQCYGWNAVHNIYEHEGKEFYFNFSKNLDSDNLFSHKKTINSNDKRKQSSYINKNNSLQPKKSNLFDVYIKKIRNKKQRANLMGFSQELRQRGKNQKLIVSEGTEQISQKQQAKLIDLQQTYWQWKGYFATTRRPKSQKRKNMSQKNKSKIKRKNDFGDCKIDGWQVQHLKTKELQSPTHEGEQKNFFVS